MNAYPTRAWLRSLMRSGVLFSVIAAVPLAIAALIIGGVEALIGCGLAAILAVGYFLAGVIGDSFAMRRADAVGMCLLLLGFGLRAAVVALILWALASNGLLEPATRQAGFVWTMLAMVIGWTVGVVRAHRSARLPIYSLPGEAS